MAWVVQTDMELGTGYLTRSTPEMKVRAKKAESTWNWLGCKVCHSTIEPATAAICKFLWTWPSVESTGDKNELGSISFKRKSAIEYCLCGTCQNHYKAYEKIEKV